MQIDITRKEISLEKLDEAIDDFKNENEDLNQIYLFMNADTISKLTLDHDFKYFRNASINIFTYCGCKVYFDDDLPFGVVNIR